MLSAWSRNPGSGEKNRVGLDLFESGNWQLHHDNAQAHSSFLIKYFIKLQISHVCEVTCSSEITLFHLRMFPKQKMLLVSQMEKWNDTMQQVIMNLAII